VCMFVHLILTEYALKGITNISSLFSAIERNNIFNDSKIFDEKCQLTFRYNFLMLIVRLIVVKDVTKIKLADNICMQCLQKLKVANSSNVDGLFEGYCMFCFKKKLQIAPII